MNEHQTQSEVEGRLRVLRIIWGALLASVGVYAVLGFVLLPQSEPPSVEHTEVNIFLGPLLIASLILVYVSFSVKNRMLTEAAARPRPGSAQQAFILGFALSEAAALMGLVGVLITGNPLSFGIIALGALGLAFHFPRREQLLGATYKNIGQTGQGGFRQQ